MAWLQTVVPFPGVQSQIPEWFKRLFETANAPKDAALFTRNTSDDRQTVFLLTPGAAAFAPKLPCHDWFYCDDPRADRWALLIGDAKALEILGLELPD